MDSKNTSTPNKGSEERKLLGICESEKAIVRLYTGPMSDTPEKRKALMEDAAKTFLSLLRKTQPEIYLSLIHI